jgi:hypothetical protein
MIKSAGIALAFALTSLASPIAASAASPGAMVVAPYLQPARLGGYACTARSRVAYGYWKGARTLAAARLGALRECAARTPRGLLCVITACN